MPEPTQPYLVIAVMVDEAERANVGWRRWDPISGAYVDAGMLPCVGRTAIAKALSDLLGATLEMPPIATPSSSRGPAPDRVMLCGCIARGYGDTFQLVPCDQHRGEL